MEKARPFSHIDVLEACADRIWASCSADDWREAFAAHPRIGEQSQNRWSRQEQSGVNGASAVLLTELATANQEYETKFGYTFIVCATGKSASEILEILRRRLHNDDATELQLAGEEQRKIMHIRLKKWITG